MKITKDLEKKFNDQITLEFEASMTYRQLAIEADRQDLSGMGQWLRAQADEEIVHANKFIDHVVDREGHAQIESIPAPELTEKTMTALEIFQAALAHEQKVSEAIRELYRETEKAGDLDARPLLNWFIDEQLEEEATVGEIVGQLELVGEDGSGLLRIDQELGQRTSDGTENEA
ncbi:ferritin [Helcobacillus massiliensis]|uniref:ferritin n=1 Tax=Helcobacillus TaxID=1161125 RepID=UPI001EF6430F|nr:MULTISPECIES: ferritin [Helcobacillus]MCG7427740.1 ferritin [Helcobacillus sp. ACRRO]MCT1557408.1 ferritin [Helcobacillus massiliensis]MCT2331697.1 ferritin [Helcobacillus massiliensis]